MTKLNKKLKKPSGIQFVDAKLKKLGTVCFTAENGQFGTDSALYMGFTQYSASASALPYQVQYCERFKRSKADAKTAGATWTAWPSFTNAKKKKVWQYRNAVARTKTAPLIPLDALESAKPADGWGCANLAVSTKGKTRAAVRLSGTVPSKYTAKQISYRIRTVNKAKGEHGEWVYGTLTINKRAAVLDECIIPDENGGFYLCFNYKHNDDPTAAVKAVKDSGGRNLLRDASIMPPITIDGSRVPGGVPIGTRTGYVAGEIHIGADKLKRSVEKGELLSVDGDVVTPDGARTPFAGPLEVSRLDLDLDAPAVIVDVDQSDYTLTVTALRTDSGAVDMVNAVGISCAYEYNGKEYNEAKPISSQTNPRETVGPCGVWKYLSLPLNTPLAFTVTLSSGYHGATVSTTQTAVLESGRLVLLNSADGARCAKLCKGVKVQETGKGTETQERTWGGDLPFVVYGTARSNEITIDGTVYEQERESAEAPNVDNLSAAAWQGVKNNPGVYIMREPSGRMARVSVPQVAMTRQGRLSCEVSVTASEVR